MYYVYILRCADGTLYTGITTDLTRRLREHLSGVGAAYTRARGAEELLFSESASTRSAALRREAEIKKLTRDMKLRLIARATISSLPVVVSTMAKGNNSQRKETKKPKKNKKK